ncbi:DUF1801 domain-containing protein [Rhodoluna sp. KAS3]|uniref:DUF1801 domain-containing protein n=1 Tax=Rhodoluna sp. KAS3 TaxID=942880 RepID=UPI0022309B6D|nr:DUF1801 domain-containing protein [Rhodoluna sp. KAS3]BDS49501.1 hypothetical protein RKAS3_10780 [Rhodoluna sp. KAS3]
MAMTAEEKQAMKETMAERSKARKKMTPEQLEAEVLEKVAVMAPADRAIAEKIHELVKTHAPSLQPKTWYGMQAYCNAEGKTVVFFQDSGKFKTRYCTLGFQDAAQLDEGSMWPTSYAVNEITPAIEKQITELIKRAVS